MSRVSRSERLQRHLSVANQRGFRLEPRLLPAGNGYRETWLVGFCPNGHDFRQPSSRFTAHTVCTRCQQSAVLQQHVDAAINAGLSVLEAGRSDGEMWIDATCRDGHASHIRAHRAKNGCPDCRSQEATRRRRDAASVQADSEGFLVEWESVEGIDYLVGVCPSQHPVRFRHDSFLRGSRCMECRNELARKAWLELAEAEGYSVSITPVSRRNGNVVRYLVGTCPVGHRMRVPGTKFLNLGARCPDCSPRGYRPARYGYLYVLERSDITGFAPAVQFGKSTSLTSRLKKHRSSGFTDTPVLLLGCEDAGFISTLESAIKSEIAARGISTCFAVGDVFDGSSEAMHCADFSTEALLRLIRDAGDEHGWGDTSVVSVHPSARDLFSFLPTRKDDLDV